MALVCRRSSAHRGFERFIADELLGGCHGAIGRRNGCPIACAIFDTCVFQTIPNTAIGCGNGLNVVFTNLEGFGIIVGNSYSVVNGIAFSGFVIIDGDDAWIYRMDIDNLE